MNIDRIPPDPLERFKFLRGDKNLRRNTFKSFKPQKALKITTDDFVNQGFIYVGNGTSDEVQCTHCGGILKGFDKDDNLYQEHRHHFPKCPFDKTVSDFIEVGGNCEVDVGLPLDNMTLSDSVFLISVEGGTKSFEEHTKKKIYDKTVFQRFRSYEDRLRSFENNGWSDGFNVKPEDCAKAGLFYKGPNDCCACIYCGGLLDEWDEGDEPIIEHDSNFERECGFCDLPHERDPQKI